MYYQLEKTKYLNTCIIFFKKISSITIILFYFFLLLGENSYAINNKTIELEHFWVSPGEKAALSLISENFRTNNGKWQESPASDYEVMKSNFIQRTSIGLPPSALWLGGEDVESFYSLGLLKDLTNISQEEKWSENIYDFVLEQAKIGNSMVALPVTIHNENWAWYNTEIYHSLGLSIPHNWDEFIKQATIIKQAGYIPLAISEQSWNIRLLFTTIMAGVGGNALYNRLYIDEDLTVFEDKKIQRALSILAQLRAFKPSPGQIKTWDQATQLLINNQAAMQIMGDWVRGDLVASGIDFKDKIICTQPPEAQKIFIAAIDFIAFPKIQNKEIQAGQQLFIKTVLDKDLQISFSKLKGSIPVRYDLQADQLNSCAAKSLPHLINKQERLLSPRMTMKEDLRSAMQKTLAAFWNKSDMTVKEVTLQLKNLKNKLNNPKAIP